MNCKEAEIQIATQLDGELDVVRSRSLDAHLEGCATCAAARASLLDLKARIGRGVPRHAAPEALRADVTRLVARVGGRGDASLPAPSRRWFVDAGRRRMFAAGALVGAAATVAIGLGSSAWLARSADGDLARQLVDAHVRATLAEHRIDVASSDQHTVKPWLSARLDFAPPVVERPLEGVELVGARIESIDRQRFAALVYRYRAHTIDVFVRPVSGHGAASASRSIRGFNVVEADDAEMEWRAVSDASTETLMPLVRQLAQRR